MPSVFLSYRQQNAKNPHHKTDVRAFAERLCSAGIEVILDQLADEKQFNHAGPDDPNGWAGWSYHQVDKADRVLMVGSAEYFRTYEDKERPDAGIGAAIETQRIRAQFFRQKGTNPRFRVVLLNRGDEQGIPDQLRGFGRFHPNRSPEDFDKLVKWLKGNPPPAVETEDNRQQAEDPSIIRQIEDFTPAFATKPVALHCIGRETQTDSLRRAFSGGSSVRAVVYGGPGLGKSTLCSDFVEESTILELYDNRVFWLSLRSEENLTDLLASLAETLHLDLPKQESILKHAILYECSHKKFLLCLDQLERVLTGADALQCEEFLCKLLTTSAASFLVTYRSDRPPLAGLEWDCELHLPPLSDTDATKVFLAYAGTKCEPINYLPALLERCGGIPLAVRLLAQQARSLRSLLRVKEVWDRHGVSFLANRQGESLAAVINASVSHPWIGDLERRALRAIAFLPLGVSRRIFDANEFGTMNQAVSTLGELGLVEGGDTSAYLLSPIREFVLEKIPGEPQVEELLANKYRRSLTFLARQIGGPRGGSAPHLLRRFLPNLQIALRLGLKSSDWVSAGYATMLFARAAAVAMIDVRSLTAEALTRVREEKSDTDEVRTLLVGLLRASAQQAESAENHRAAVLYLEEALEIIERPESVDNEQLRPRTMRDLGDAYSALHDYDKSHKFLEKAKGLFRELGNKRDIDSCHLTAAEWHFRRGGEDRALEIVETVIEHVAESNENAENRRTPDTRTDYERVKAKAYYLRSRIIGVTQPRKAAADLVRAMNLFSPAGDVRSCFRVAGTLAELLAKPGTPASLEESISRTLVPKPHLALHRARANFLIWAHKLLAQRETDSRIRAKHESLARLFEKRVQNKTTAQS